MQLHAEAILDLHERPHREIQFRAVAGDFGVLQGKFILSEPEFEVSTSTHASAHNTNLHITTQKSSVPSSTGNALYSVNHAAHQPCSYSSILEGMVLTWSGIYL